MSHWWQSLRAEARAVFTDAGAALVLVGAVFVYAGVYPIPYAAGVLRHLPVAVVDLDGTAMSRQLTRMIDAHQFVDVATPVVDALAAEREVRAGRLAGYIVVPRDFERSVLAGDRATVSAFVDATYVLAYRQVLAGVLESVGTLSAGAEMRRAQVRGASPAQAAARREPFHVVTRPLFNATESYATYIVPGVLVLILQQTLLIGIGLVAGTRREREGATAAMAGPGAGVGVAVQRVAGRTTFYLVLYGAYAAIYLGVVFGLQGFPVRAAAWDLAVFILPFLLATALLGQVIGAWFGERETAMFALVWTSLPAAFLAGFAWPREAMPAWMVVAGQFVPSTSAIDGLLRLTQLGASLDEVARQITVLWSLAWAYGALAVLGEWARRRSISGGASA